MQLIRNIHWEQQSCIRIGKVRQGCVSSPDLFNLYIKTILREIEDLNGFVISGRNITNLWYTDDTIHIADAQEKIQALLNE